MRVGKWSVRDSTRASPFRSGRRWTRRAGCWRWPMCTPSLSASSAGSTCRRRTSMRRFRMLRTIRNSWACGTSSRPSPMAFSAARVPTRHRALERFGLPYDILVYARQLPEAIEFASAFPTVGFVLDHLGKPDIRNDGFGPGIATSAGCRRCRTSGAKLSGLVTEAHWHAWTPSSSAATSTPRSNVSERIAS